MVRLGAARAGARRPAVVLTGGCFQNALLAESVCRRLAGDFDVRLHREVPPGDGGVALGQAVVADAVVRAAAPPVTERAGAES
jgi:hydrogenase maturation protein HypF